MINRSVFQWIDSADPERFLRLVLEKLSDESFIALLEQERGRGRNDYPVDLLWRGLLASFVCKTASIAQLRRKMGQRFDLFSKIPSTYSFSRFFSVLDRFVPEIEALGFNDMHEKHPLLGRMLAVGQMEGLHVLWEPQYCLPLLFHQSQSGESCAMIAEQLIERFSQINGELFQRAHYLLASASYEELIKTAWIRWGLRPIIPRLQGSSQTLYPFRQAYYDDQGSVFCPAEGNRRAMIYAGFENNRQTLKYRCMARHYSAQCEHLASCPLRSGLRVPLSLDERIFTPLPRSSYRWKQIFSLYHETETVLIRALQPYLQLANNEAKKILCCRMVSLLARVGLSVQVR